MQYYQINAGYAAVMNGAIAPLTTMFDIASVLDTEVIPGNYYGDDCIPVPNDPEIKQIAEQLLNESKLIWKIVDKLP